jgi:hypothetical protein
MRDDERRTALAQPFDRAKDQSFRLCVECRGRLVEMRIGASFKNARAMLNR